MNWNPYIAFLRIAWPYLLGAILVGGAYGWAHHRGAVSQKAHDAKIIAALNATIVADDAAIKTAGDALRAQNEANAARIKAAEQAARDAGEAAVDASKAADQMAQQIFRFPARLEKARQSPPCAVLLKTDVLKVCGL